METGKLMQVQKWDRGREWHTWVTQGIHRTHTGHIPWELSSSHKQSMLAVECEPITFTMDSKGASKITCREVQAGLSALSRCTPRHPVYPISCQGSSSLSHPIGATE